MTGLGLDLPAAGRCLDAARWARIEGRPADAAALCRSVLDDLHDTSPAADRLRVVAVHVLLTASELTRSDLGTGIVHDLVELARVAAGRAGDPGSGAYAHYWRGRELVASDNLERSIAALSEAVRLARSGDEPLLEVLGLVELGHHTVGRDLPRGLALLERARALAATVDTGDDELRSAEWGILLGRLEAFVGVGEFDAGRFDPGEELLRHALDSTAALPEQAVISNYLGQLLVAAGRFEEAWDLLDRSLRRLDPTSPDSMWRGYNLGLLGKLFLEWERPDEADGPLRTGWEVLLACGDVSVLPILRNYRAELLLAPGYPARDPAAAAALAEETVAECRRTGFQRSEVGALAIGALAALELGAFDEARDRSGRAAAQLDRATVMPALRTEEVYLIRSEVLRVTGDPVGAASWGERARSVLLAKAATIADPDRRRMFLTRVPVSRAVLARGAAA